MEEFKQISLGEVKKYIDDLRPVSSPFFCELCCIIRATPDNKKTYLDSWEELLYKTRGMCTKCFQYLNYNANDEEMEKRIKLWEESGNLKIKREKNARVSEDHKS